MRSAIALSHVRVNLSDLLVSVDQLLCSARKTIKSALKLKSINDHDECQREIKI